MGGGAQNVGRPLFFPSDKTGRVILFLVVEFCMIYFCKGQRGDGKFEEGKGVATDDSRGVGQ